MAASLVTKGGDLNVISLCLPCPEKSLSSTSLQFSLENEELLHHVFQGMIIGRLAYRWHVGQRQDKHMAD